jgi:hypothetical protein
VTNFFADRVMEETTTTGTGTVTLTGARLQHVTFASEFSVGDYVVYSITDPWRGDWESGFGRLATTTTLERLAVTASSNAGALVSFDVGSKLVYCGGHSAAMALNDMAIFGDGSDGDVTISSGVTSMARDMYYRKLTISGTGRLITVGYRIFANEIDLSAAPANAITPRVMTAGNSGSGTAGGAGKNSDNVLGTIVGTSSTATGGNGGTTAGASGGQQQNTPSNPTVTVVLGGNGGPGGSGGAGSGGAGGTTVNNAGTFRLNKTLIFDPQENVIAHGGGNSGGGGAGGGGDGTVAGGGGAAGGQGQGIVWIATRLFRRGVGTAAGAIGLTGGAGGAGAAAAATNRGGGGGAGGGGGGHLYMIINALVGTAVADIVELSGGAGGNGGNAVGGSGLGGAGGGGGASGSAVLIRLDTQQAVVLAARGSPTAIVTTATVTGGTGAAGVAGTATI